MKTFLKSSLILIALVMMSFLTKAQSEQSASNSNKQEMWQHYRLKYVFGMKYNDWRVAADALYNMIAMDPSNDSLRMRLGYMYYENNVYPSALFVSQDVLSRNPDNTSAMRMKAVCYDNMGVRDKAISAYESLYLAEDDINILYQVAALQYETGRLEEGRTNANIVADNKNAPNLELQFPVGDKKSQKVKLNAAAHYLLGMIENKSGNTEEAKKQFNKALEIAPDFEAVKKEMEKL